MPEGKNKQERELPSRVARREPTKPNPQSLTSRERKKIAKLMRHLPGGSGRRIAETARHKQGESNRGKDLMSDAERDQRLRGSNRVQRKKTKNRKGVVAKISRTSISEQNRDTMKKKVETKRQKRK